jgi:integrase
LASCAASYDARHGWSGSGICGKVCRTSAPDRPESLFSSAIKSLPGFSNGNDGKERELSLWKRGGVYWTYVWIDGVRRAKSTGTANRRQAETIDQRFKEELNLERQGIRQLSPHMTFGELAARFLAGGSRRPYHVDRLKALLPYFSEMPIGRINRSMAQDYRRYRHSNKKLTETTVNRDLQALRHFLFWAVDEGLLAANPLSRMRLVPERRKPRPVLSLSDELKLLAAASGHFKPIVMFALDTGMRRGEVLNQRWEHVDFDRRLLMVTKSKTAGGEGREIPLTERVHEFLVANRQEAGLLFTFKGKPLLRTKTAWKATVRRAGIRYLRFHDLRHTFNTRLMEAGVMQEVRKALMGHSSGKDVNSIYTHVEFPVKREAIRKLEAWVATHNPQPQPKGETHDGSEGARSYPLQGVGITSEALEEENAGRGRARPN